MRKLLKYILFVLFIILSVFVLVSCGEEQAEKEQPSEKTSETIDSATGCPLDYNPICGEDGLTYQNTCFSSLRDVSAEHIGACEYTVCSFNGQDHYILNNMLYYEDDQGRPYINVLYGSFNLQVDGEGWTYVRAINKESSYYYNRMLEYDAKMTESGNEIVCQTTTETPEYLKEFLKTHGKIMELKIASYTENNSTETNSSD